MKSTIKIGFIFLAIFFVASPAVSATFSCAVTGHDYEFIENGCNTSWTTSRDQAAAADGYLVTVTSAEEQACLETNAVALPGVSYWTGGSDLAQEQTWIWVTGPETGRQFWQGGPAASGSVTTAPDNYAKWFASEPNSSSEDYMVWNTGPFGWVDVGLTNSLVCGYLIEYNVPLPEEVFGDGFENKIVFVTSQTFTGDLLTAALFLLGSFSGTSVEAGDAICNKLAGDAGLNGSYTAWISGLAPGQNAIDRVTNATVPYLLTEGTKVTDDFLQFITPPDVFGDRILDISICKDEMMVLHCEPASTILTGTTIEGVLSVGENCENWTCGSSECDVLVGSTDNSFSGRTIAWTEHKLQTCETERRIYCFQD